jgi:Holliday junction resolvase RusA-like endonuclease
MAFNFIVFGKPVPQGSKQAQAIYGKGGKPVIKNGRVITVVRNDNDDLQNWRNQVADKALDVYRNATHTSPDNIKDPELIAGPISLTIVFVRPRLKGHFGTGRNAGKLKASAPEHPISKPDTVKLARAVEDAMTGVIWVDDSQVVRHALTKRWGERFETHVTITEL